MSLKYVQIETTSTCNQRCTFCPVSVSKRAKRNMPMQMFKKIVSGLDKLAINTIYLNGFNEPTFDKTLVEKVKLVHQLGINIHINSNASGLNAELIKELLVAGVSSFTINLSTIDESQFISTRGSRGLKEVLINTSELLKQSKDYPCKIDILVLGNLDQKHAHNISSIKTYFSLSNEQLTPCPIANFAAGAATPYPQQPIFHKKVFGCASKRHTEWLHFTPSGEAILCCQDYPGNYKVGNISQSFPKEIHEGDEFKKIRQKVNGKEETDSDFICHSCVFAIGEESYQQKMDSLFCNRCQLPEHLGNSGSCQLCVIKK